MSKVIELKEAYFHSGVKMPRCDGDDSANKLLVNDGASYVNHIHIENPKFKGKFRLYYDGDRVFVYKTTEQGQGTVSPVIVSNTNIRYVAPIESCSPKVFIGKPDAEKGGEESGQKSNQKQGQGEKSKEMLTPAKP